MAEEAARGVGALGATVLLICRGGRLRVGGAWGVSERHRRELESRGAGAPAWELPRRLALCRRRQIVVPRVEADLGSIACPGPAGRGGHLSLATTPLVMAGAVVGALDVYRPDSGLWTRADLELLSRCADHTVAATRISALADRHRRQSAAIERLLHGLRDQTHEHANRLHAIGALVSMGEAGEAQRFVADLMTKHDEFAEALVGGIEEPTLAGLLPAEIATARERGITLEVDPSSHLSHPPEALSEVDWLALVGTLLDYALEGISNFPPHRRRVVFQVGEDAAGVVFGVRDFGHRLESRAGARRFDAAPSRPGAFEPSLRPVAESLLRDAAHSAGAKLTIEPRRPGTLTTVRL